MKIIRWLGFIPLAGIVAILCGIAIGRAFPSRSFDPNRLLLSIVSPWGLAPQIAERLLPVAIFVVLGAAIAPGVQKKIVVGLGLLGGVFGWPLPIMLGPYDHVFYAASAAGTLIGCALGMLLAFRLQNRRSVTTVNSGELTLPSVADLKR